MSNLLLKLRLLSFQYHYKKILKRVHFYRIRKITEKYLMKHLSYN